MAGQHGGSHEWVRELGPQDLQLARTRTRRMAQLGGLEQHNLDTIARAFALSVVLNDQPFVEGLLTRVRRMVDDAVRSAQQQGRWEWLRQDVLAHVKRLETIVSYARVLLAPQAWDLLDSVEGTVLEVAGKAWASIEEHDIRREFDELARRARDCPASTRLRRL